MNTMLLNKNWIFHFGDCPDAWYKGYQALDWKEVTIPHDWSVSKPFSREYSSGTGYLAGGIGWYRKSFTLPESYRGKKISIVFDGVYKNSQVWCNSYYCGKRPNGYTTFQYDITDQVQFGDVENLIAVKVDHRDISDSRWFTGSGITRKVSIIIQDPVHLDFEGVFFTTPSVSADKAEVSITNAFTNDTASDVTVTIENTLIDLKGNTALLLKSNCTLPANSSQTVTNHGEFSSPYLWSVDTPNLYQLTTKLYTNDGSVPYEDMKQERVGIRSFSFDSDKGFFLNEVPMKLKGVCLHHDAGCLGAAVFSEVWMRRLLKLKEMGCNAIRMSHNPHMPELYDICDALGFLVIDEAFDEWEGAKNKWSTGHNVYPPKHQGYFEDFPEWHERDLVSLIKRDRNHPSIIMWSIGNEIDYPNDPYCHPLFDNMTGNNDKNKPENERQYDSNKPNAERLSVIATMLSGIVKRTDTTRPVSAAVAFPELSTQIGFIDSFDVVGYNYKEHLYEQDHLRFPQKPFLGSENSHSFKAWNAVTENDYISGQFLWTGIDYLGEAHGWPIHGSGAGIMTLAGFEKSSYYRRKSFWSEKPVVYLVTSHTESSTVMDQSDDAEWKPMYRSWNYTADESIEVRCYTNLAQVELFCNEKSIGVQKNKKDKGYISWTLPYEEGTVKAIGMNSLDENQTIAVDLIETTLASSNIKLNLWKAPKDFYDENLSAIEHSSIAQIEVTITDGHGRRVYNDSSMLGVAVTGSGELLGLENGDLGDNTDYTAFYRRVYEGRLIIYVRNTDNQGETTVTVEGNGLKSATLTY